MNSIYLKIKPEDFYGKRISVYNIENDCFVQGESLYDFPVKFSVLSSAISDITGDGINETIFIRNDILYVYSGQELLYIYSEKVGSNTVMLTYDIDPNTPHVRQNTVSIELPPITHDFDGDGIAELIVTTSNRDLLGSIVGVSNANDNSLILFKYEKNQFIKGSIDKVLVQQIKGFSIFNDKIFVVVSSVNGLLKDVQVLTGILLF
jgi:hypothetical protein